METPEHSELEQRKAQVMSFLRTNKSLVYFALLIIVILVTFSMRMMPIKNLRDVTTNQYIPAEPDSFIILYYAEYILEHGEIPTVDNLRYYPTGFLNVEEFFVLPHFIFYLYKILSFFNSSITIQYADLLYPPLTFAISLIFFFLFVSRLFNRNVGLISTAYLSVSSLYLYRTTAGFSDKESLALMFLYIALYYFTLSWTTENLKKALFFSLIAGGFTALVGLTWGGVQFAYFSIGLFVLLQIFLGTFQTKEILAFIIWFLTSYLVLFAYFPEKFGVYNLIANPSYIPSTVAFIVAALLLYFQHRAKHPFLQKLAERKHLGLAGILVTLLAGFLFFLLFFGPSYIVTRMNDLIVSLTNPFTATRWAKTVAESRQPYLVDIINDIGKLFFAIFFAGLIVMVYQCFKSVKEHKIKFTFVFSFLFFAILFNRYSSNSTLNGDSPLSKLMYFGSFILVILFIIGVYLYSHYKRIHIHQELRKLNPHLLFMLSFTFITLLAARSAIRLFVIFAPVAAIIIGYALDFAYAKIASYKKKFLTYTAVGVILIILFMPAITIGAKSYSIKGNLLNSYEAGYAQSKHSGSSYNQQWQAAMKWVRENTPPTAVFAHWWDYGYYVIYGSRRATLSDGGNSGGSGLNYFIGRHVLTGQNNTEALEYLKSKGATHLLIVSDELGKYPAYSSIGSDANNDRFSYVPVFSMDPSKTQETRNQTLYVYLGSSFTFDEDFTYEDELYPAGSSYIGAFLIPMDVNKDSASVQQPEAIVIHNGQQKSIPVECAVISKRIVRFTKPGLKGCVQIIPRLYGDGRIDYVANALYVSRRVSNTLFAQLYLFGQTWEGFKLAYSDEDQLPIAIYPQGNFFGPMKIWEMEYPKGIEEKEMYKTNEIPDQKLL